jgi:hypothetical protein
LIIDLEARRPITGLSEASIKVVRAAGRLI